MATSQRHISLAKTLPIRLQKFLALNPPRISARPTATQLLEDQSASTELVLLPPDAQLAGESSNSSTRKHYYNPFQPHKNPKTGKWNPPIYSLRRQAELFKLARDHGVEDLLPHSAKDPEVRARKRQEEGLRVKGTGVGQRVKGKLQEREMKGKLEKRRQAMMEMPALIQQWRTRGHGRGWRKWPSGSKL